MEQPSCETGGDAQSADLSPVLYGVLPDDVAFVGPLHDVKHLGDVELHQLDVCTDVVLLHERCDVWTRFPENIVAI